MNTELDFWSTTWWGNVQAALACGPFPGLGGDKSGLAALEAGFPPSVRVTKLPGY